jgi:hypothetical protein
VKFTVSILEKRSEGKQRRWSHLFGGRMRTSTLVLIIAFLVVWWVYDTYRPEPAPKPPAPQVVPPGFVPDPNYTWVPRSRVQQPPATVTFTPTPTTAVPPSTTVLPTPPCLLPPPFCPPSSSPTPPPPQLPVPGPGPAPTSPLPAS